MRQRPDRQLLQADDVGTVARHELDHLHGGTRAVPAARACRGRGSKSARAWPRRSVRGRARPARRSAGLHAAVRPRARRGARAGGRGGRARHVSLSLRRRARAGRIPATGALLSRSRRASSAGRRCALPVKVAEHPLGLASLRRIDADVLHVQWLPAPELDAFLFRPHLPSVFTAHDLLPRRTAHRTGPLAPALRPLRPDRRAQRERPRHARRARRRAEKLRVIPHPVFPSDPERHGRRPHGARVRDDPAVQGARRRDRGRAAGR